jgi:hypothetical protein
MDKKIANVWIKDLETTTAPRTRNGLKNKKTGGFCCLGRLGLVLKREFPEVLQKAGYEWKKNENGDVGFIRINREEFYFDNLIKVPPEIRKVIRMTADEEQDFIFYNDTVGMSFKKIAKKVHEYYFMQKSSHRSE